MSLATLTFRVLLEKPINARRDQFQQLPLPENRVLFIGDSITEGGNWDEWFPEFETLNRGIGGDTIDGVSTRLRTAINKPAAISLLIGTNDLTLTPRRRIQEIPDKFARLVADIRVHAPDTPLIINSIMPRTPKRAAAIQRINTQYQQVAANANATYLDLWPTLADGDALKAAFTLDNLHLNGAGYRAWADVLRPHLAAAVATTRDGDSPVR